MSLTTQIIKTITIDLTVDTGAYASGDCLCDSETITGAAVLEAGYGIIEKIVLIDQAKQDAAIDFLFFDTDPSNTTFTKNSALDVVDADLDNCVGGISIASADYIDASDNSVATVDSIGVNFNCASGSKDLYLAGIARDTPTYATTGDLRLRITLLR